MSEQIQSISQGNYILKGTVATSAGIVGDGSTQNPLRADETVLYETTGDGRNSSFTLSEAATNFEFLRFQGIGWNNGPCLVTIPAPSGTTNNISVTYLYYCANTDGNPLQIDAARYSTTDAKTYNKIDSKFLYWSLNGVTTGGNNTQNQTITKVVGINRIANN